MSGSSLWLGQTTGGDLQATAGSLQHLASSASCSLALPTPLSASMTSNENLSLAVENGTSFNSSRLELDEFGSDDENELTFHEEDGDNFDGEQSNDDNKLQHIYNADDIGYTGDKNGTNFPTTNQDDNDNQINSEKPFVRETINDFCVRHSREELEYLIGQVSCFRISDCHFSERNSTLCMVIEVMADDDDDDVSCSSNSGQ